MCASINTLPRLAHREVRTYNVLFQVGKTLAPFVPYTGSSDLWMFSSSCSADCFSVTVPLYLQTSFQPSSLAIRLQHSDTLTGSFAQGSVGKDVAGIAGLQLQDQYLAAISEMNKAYYRQAPPGYMGSVF